jgi:hypothetical protein
MGPLVRVVVGGEPVGAEPVLVEVDERGEGVVRAARPGDVVAAVTGTFSDAVARVRPMAEAIRAQFAGLVDRPDEVGVVFGLKVHADAGVVVAHTSAEANFQVSLVWRGDQDTR